MSDVMPREWRPIDSAPMDGTRILLTDGKLMAVGARDFSIESDTLPDLDRWSRDYGAYTASLPLKPSFKDDLYGMEKSIAWDSEQRARADLQMHSRPNPDAGVRREWWELDGCTALVPDAKTYDDDGPSYFKPTHWMPLPDLPV